MLSKIIVEYFVENMSIEEMRKFNNEVLKPQNAKNLSEHIVAAENILLQKKAQAVNVIGKVKNEKEAFVETNGR